MNELSEPMVRIILSAMRAVDMERFVMSVVDGFEVTRNDTDDEMIARYSDTPVVDDPPSGWTRHDLAMYLRGRFDTEQRLWRENISAFKPNLDALSDDEFSEIERVRLEMERRFGEWLRQNYGESEGDDE